MTKKKDSKFVLQPLYDRIVARRLDPISQTEGGLEIPEMAQEKPQEGIVLTVGPGRVNPGTGEFVPMLVKEGEKILFGKYAGMEVEADDGVIVILREDEILGIVKSGGTKDLGIKIKPGQTCKKHPKYQGKIKPRTTCKKCQEIYVARHGKEA